MELPHLRFVDWRAVGRRAQELGDQDLATEAIRQMGNQDWANHLDDRHDRNMTDADRIKSDFREAERVLEEKTLELRRAARDVEALTTDLKTAAAILQQNLGKIDVHTIGQLSANIENLMHMQRYQQ